MKILVTGADGFVGRHAVKRLLASGHEVVGLTEDGTSPDPIRAHRADIRDHHVLVRIIEKEQPEAVLHLAAIAFVPAVRANPRGAFEINAGGTLALLTAVRDAAPLARVVTISSSEVYGPVADPQEMPLLESRPIRPISLYGASKAAAEHLCRALAGEGLDVVVLRPFNHIGPGQSDDFVVSSFAHQVARLERSDEEGVVRHGNLDAVRDFLDVRDIVRAYEQSLTAERGRLVSGEPYNLCSGVGVRIGELVERLVGKAQRPLRTEVDPERLRPVDVPIYLGSARKFRDAVGFEPEVTLDQTLDDVLADARAATASP